MTIRELKALLADLPDDDRIAFAVFFNWGDERVYRPHRECGDVRTITTAYGTRYHILARADNSIADRIDNRGVNDAIRQ